MIRPLQQDDALLADLAAARRDPAALHVWWLGQSGFLAAWSGVTVLFDPYLSDSLTKKYAGTDKPHVRVSGRVIAPERLDFVDVVTSSHNHTDHLDPETLRLLAQANPGLLMVCPEANRATVRERSGLPDERILGLEAGGQSEIGNLRSKITFHAVPAAHEALDVDSQGRHLYLGFVVRLGPFTVYHAGDTVRYAGMAERLRPFALDAALLPINGRAPERRVAGNLDGPEAAQLAHDLGARQAVPCHYDLFAFNTASPDAFVAACEALRQPHRVLRLGERLTLGAADRR